MSLRPFFTKGSLMMSLTGSAPAFGLTNAGQSPLFASKMDLVDPSGMISASCMTTANNGGFAGPPLLTAPESCSLAFLSRSSSASTLEMPESLPRNSFTAPMPRDFARVVCFARIASKSSKLVTFCAVTGPRLDRDSPVTHGSHSVKFKVIIFEAREPFGQI